MSDTPKTSWYERHVLPHLLHCACGVKPIRRQRQKVVPLAHGRVLEIGIGTGLNLPHYDRSKVSQLTGVDPALRMHPMAQRLARQSGIAVDLVGLSAEKLPLADASVDSIVCTYTLCTIPDPVAALHEMRRVLAPGGALLFSEHGQAPDESVRRWQDRLQPLWGRIAGGCHLGRDIPQLLRQGGFKADIQSRYLPGPRFASYHYWGSAVPD